MEHAPEGACLKAYSVRIDFLLLDIECVADFAVPFLERLDIHGDFNVLASFKIILGRVFIDKVTPSDFILNFVSHDFSGSLRNRLFTAINDFSE